MSFSIFGLANKVGKLSRAMVLQNNILQATPKRMMSNLFEYSSSDGRQEDTLYKTIDIEMKGHDTAVMSSYEKFLNIAAAELDIKVHKTWTPPKYLERWTLLKSAHIYRKHMVQYEARTHFRVLQLMHLTGSTADTYLEYIQRNLPEGMAMKVCCLLQFIQSTFFYYL